jgi:hypothetical protein
MRENVNYFRFVKKDWRFISTNSLFIRGVRGDLEPPQLQPICIIGVKEAISI